MAAITVHLSESERKGHAYVGEEATPQAEMTYSKAGDTLLIIDHTEVGESLRGQGVGRLMLEQIVAMAREKQLKIMPLCPFA
ncbi:MAG: GNAT family N-acetyltransferase, partial [Bacteroidota bacterium]